jgi:hypothetical protein
MRKNCLISGRILLLYQFIKKVDNADCSNYRGISLLSNATKFCPTSLSQGKVHIHNIEEIIGDYQGGFRCNRSTTDQIFCIRQILERKWEYNETVHQLFTDIKESCDSVRREVLYNILIEFGVPIILVRLITSKLWLNETCIKFNVGKHLSGNFPIQNDLKQGNVLSPLLCNFTSVCSLWSSGQSSWLQIRRPGFDSRHYQIFWKKK